MPTVIINVDGINAGDSSGFGVASSDIVGIVSDGDTGTTITNQSVDLTLEFSLQDISDVAVLSGATLNSIKCLGTAASSGKSAILFGLSILNSDGDALVSDNEFSTSSASQTDFEGTSLDISSFSTDQFNGLQLKYRTLEETQVVASRIRAQVDYTAAAVTSTPYLKLGLGRYKISKGRLKVV